MAGGELPPEIVAFISSHLASVEHLEILLLISNSGRTWTAQAVDHVIKSNPVSVADRLKDLCTARLLVERPGPPPVYSFEPTSREIRALVSQLAALYKERRVRVIHAIYSRPESHVQGFADAFRFRKNQ